MKLFILKLLSTRTTKLSTITTVKTQEEKGFHCGIVINTPAIKKITNLPIKNLKKINNCLSFIVRQAPKKTFLQKI